MLVVQRNEAYTGAVKRHCTADSEIVIDTGRELIVITLVEIRGQGRARIGVEAPKNIAVHRREVWDEIQKERSAPPEPTS